MAQSASPLEYGMFVMPIHDPAKPLSQCFDEDLELAVQCDQLGFSAGKSDGGLRGGPMLYHVIPSIHQTSTGRLPGLWAASPVSICIYVYVAHLLPLIDVYKSRHTSQIPT